MHKFHSILRLVIYVFLSTCILSSFAHAALLKKSEDEGNLLNDGLQWREVGPYRGGRSAAIAGIPQQPKVYYFGAAGGGVWKTTDSGRSWNNISDGYFGGSIGAVAVSEWDSNVIYAGGGEKTVRGNVSHGDGLWKSEDAGKTWKHMGLSESRHIPRIRIHPKNPDLVYVSVMGHLFGPNKERGVYRSKDGGSSWEKILFVNENAGSVDLVMDPGNPRVLYATFWRIRRTPWSLESGGEGSGIWKTTDSGDTWTEITRNKGLPQGIVGISGITVSKTNPDNLYTIIEAENGGVFRSRDGGDTWEKTNESRDLRQRAWYYSRLYADPNDEESIYVLNVSFHRSKDGGKSLEEIFSVSHGDNHDLWIDPDDSKRMIASNDGGAHITQDGGKTWTSQSNQPTAQMYRVSVDNAFPYRLLGGQQDNSTVRIRSRSAFGSAIGLHDWDATAGGESGHVVAKPDDPDIVFGGSYGGTLSMMNHRTGEQRAIDVWPDNPMGWGAAELKYRFQWNFPLFFSPHNPNRLYAAANVLFRSDNAGASWQAISPDLTRNDKSTMQASGGPITKDNTGVEYYGTIFAALESPHERGVLWAGSDDGRVHISRDDGQNWTEVTPKRLPENMMINSIEAHPSEKGGLYMAATRYKSDDFKPYLYKTTNYGKSWELITMGIDPLHFTRVIRADPTRSGLLYAGTENGVYVSFNDGGEWEPLQLNLPIVPITDLAIKQKNLIAATQGRGYWILDDLFVIHQFDEKVKEADYHLFSPGSAYRLSNGRDDEPNNMGQNPYDGSSFYYLLSQDLNPDKEIQLDIVDSDGILIQSFTRAPESEEDENADDAGDEEENNRQLKAEQGLNHFAWNFTYPGTKMVEDLVLWNEVADGPRAIPGSYKAKLIIGDWEQETDFEILADPRSSASLEDLKAQFDFIIRLRDKVNEAHKALESIQLVREKIDTLVDTVDDESISEAAAALKESMAAIEEMLYQTKMESPQDPLNFPIRLNDKLSGVIGLAGTGDFPPTQQMTAVADMLGSAVDAELEKLKILFDDDLAAFNQLVRNSEVPAISVP